MWLGKVNKCSSGYAFDRVLSIYSKAIVLELGLEESSIVDDLIVIQCKLLDKLFQSNDRKSIQKALGSIKAVLSPLDVEQLSDLLWKSEGNVSSICSILSTINPSYKRKQVLAKLLQHLINTLASPGEVYSCEKYLESLTVEEWQENGLSAALSSKMKSKPDSSLEFMEAFFDVANVPDDIDMEDFITFGIKQLKKRVDVLFLTHLPCGDKVIENLVTALKKKQFTQWKQRKAAYQVITQFSNCVIPDQTLLDFTTAVSQEDKSVDTDLSCKSSALTALISLFKPSKTAGYKAVLQFFASSLSDKSFRFKFLALLEEVSQDRLVVYVKDMFQLSSFKSSILDAFVDNATKKLSSKSSVSILLPHFIDGVLATYLLLLNNSPPSPQLSKTFSKSSFLCSSFAMDILTSQDKHGLSNIIPQCILLYCKYLSKTESTQLQKLFSMPKSEVNLSVVLATCILTGGKAVLDTLSKILSYVPSAIPALVHALYTTINNLSLYNTQLEQSIQATRSSREEYVPIMEELPSHIEKKYHLVNARKAIQSFVELEHVRKESGYESYYSLMAVLSHVGTTLTTGKRQRNACVGYLETLIGYFPFIISEDSTKFILESTSKGVSVDIQNAVISFMSSLSIYSGDNYDLDEETTTEWDSCTIILPHLLANQLSELNKQISEISLEDIEMYRYDSNTLYRTEDGDSNQNTTTKKAAMKGKKSEEEEWEEEIRKELEKKKQKKKESSNELSKEDKILLQQQQERRCYKRLVLLMGRCWPMPAMLPRVVAKHPEHKRPT